MSHASARVADILVDVSIQRSKLGITGATKRSITPGSAPTAIDAERIDATENARDTMRRAEAGQRAETKRLNARLIAIRAAQRTAQASADAYGCCTDLAGPRVCSNDCDRAVRLRFLAEGVALRVASMTDASFARPATLADWMPRGRFANYARRYDLGFIGWDADDLAMEAFELITRERNAAIEAGEPVGMRNEPTADGSVTAGHTLGEGYRAIKRAYRVGLGFYGYERRGTVIERDDSPRGYVATESHSVTMLKLKGADESAIRAALIALGGIDSPPLAEVDPETVSLVNRRQRALGTLARRFPLNTDGRMLALAALLAEGYTFGETCDALGIAERTAERWAQELSRVA